jgi:hypothetical protein
MALKVQTTSRELPSTHRNNIATVRLIFESRLAQMNREK